MSPGPDREPQPDPDPTALLELARSVAAAAVELLDRSMARTDLQVLSKSSHTDLVTEIDQAAEALIIDRLLQARPHDAILGEESGARSGGSGVRWVIDPIDGTTNFVYRLAPFAVSIAAELHGVMVAGVVAVPGWRETFEATLGGGARCNGVPIAASANSELASALIGTGFSYDAGRRIHQGEVASRLLGQVRDLRRMGAASVDLCAVACGRLDGYFEAELKPWDHAAGALIATEAGATVTDLWGGPPSSTYVVAAGPGLHRTLREVLITAGAGTDPDPRDANAATGSGW
ncbi:MAG: inositol monophosphatase family protein [Acidimicrobiales bacterium]